MAGERYDRRRADARRVPSPRTRSTWKRSTVRRLPPAASDNGAPGLRPNYHDNYYGAFVLDPDGHNVEAVCRRAASTVDHRRTHHEPSSSPHRRRRRVRPCRVPRCARTDLARQAGPHPGSGARRKLARRPGAHDRRQAEGQAQPAVHRREQAGGGRHGRHRRGREVRSGRPHDPAWFQRSVVDRARWCRSRRTTSRKTSRRSSSRRASLRCSP